MKPPRFRYHPSPVQTGAFLEQRTTCACCKRTVDYAYALTPYAPSPLDGQLCPWCIADGSAHDALGVTFVSPASLMQTELSDEIIDEITNRTPGFSSWQEECWLTHCDDGCAFLGSPSEDILNNLSHAEKQAVAIYFGDDLDWLEQTLKHYPDETDTVIYHFRCLTCGSNQLYAEFA